MQTPKAKTGSPEVPRRKSPTTPQTAQQFNAPVSESESAGRTQKDKSPKVTERKSARGPVTEKKHPRRISELESRLAQLQEDLKKANDQLNTSKSWKRQAQQDAEDNKKQLLIISTKLKESQQQIMDISASEDARFQELRKISNDRDNAWQSELEAIQKQHSLDSAALASATSEIQKLKVQLELVAESEAVQSKHAESAHAELRSLRTELTQTLSLVDKIKNEIIQCRDSEIQALEIVSKNQKQLEEANRTVDMLRSDGIKAMEAFNSLSLELKQSNAQVKTLEELMSKLQADLAYSGNKILVNSVSDPELMQECGGNEETDQLKSEFNILKLEVGRLRTALEASETRYQQEHIQNTLQIQSDYEEVERTKLESSKRQAELEAELKEAETNIEGLRANLINKETELCNISEENEGLSLKMERNQPSERESELAMELVKLEHDLAELKANLMDKETQLRSVTEQNETLRKEVQKGDVEKTKVNSEAMALAETAKAAEQEALIKLGYLTEEVNKSSGRAARVTEQLDAAQVANTEMEAELRRLKVQADQWRKAAEAATAMLSTGNNRKFVERTVSFDSNYDTIGGATGSPYSEDVGDDSLQKKHGKMLKKIGVLWNKGPK